jgi:hypothetical protein
MRKITKPFHLILKETANKIPKPISGSVPAGTIDPRLFKMKPLPKDAITEMGKMLDEYEKSKKDFGIY